MFVELTERFHSLNSEGHSEPVKHSRMSVLDSTQNKKATGIITRLGCLLKEVESLLDEASTKIHHLIKDITLEKIFKFIGHFLLKLILSLAMLAILFVMYQLCKKLIDNIAAMLASHNQAVVFNLPQIV